MKKIIKENYVIHYEKAYGYGNTQSFEVYPIVHWKNSNSEEGYNYYNKETSEFCEFDEDKVVLKMHGSYCWRGVWEARYHFPDDEYWYDDLEELYFLFRDVIEPEMRKEIELIEGRKLE